MAVNQLLIAQVEIEIKAELDTAEIRIGEQAQLTITATFPSGKDIILPIFSDTITKNIEIISVEQTDTLFNENDLTEQTISQIFTITAFDTGYYVIRPFQFIIDNQTYESNPLLFIVSTVPIDLEQEIKTIKPPIEVRYTLVDWLKDNYLKLLLVFTILVGLVVLILYLRKQAKRPKTKKETPKVVIPPHLEALERLQEIATKKLWQSGETKQYYSEITEVLQKYLEKRFTVNVLEKTTDEIMQTIRMKPIEQSNRDDLFGLFKLADLVKFAKEKPIHNENEEAMNIARRFVENTKAVQTESEK